MKIKKLCSKIQVLEQELFGNKTNRVHEGDLNVQVVQGKSALG